MGRKGPRAKTKIVLKSVKQWEQLENMHNLKFQTFLNKNHPTSTVIFGLFNAYQDTENKVMQKSEVDKQTFRSCIGCQIHMCPKAVFL